MKPLIACAVAALLTTSAMGAGCRDAKGKFVKCPPAGAMPGGTASKGGTASALPAGVTKDAKGRCHAAGGKFVACPK